MEEKHEMSKKTSSNSREHGNFKGYYKFRDKFNTEEHRLSGILKEWVFGKNCLDIGCNEGRFTLEIARKYIPRVIIGIDIDPRIIDSAISSVKRERYHSQFQQQQQQLHQQQCSTSLNKNFLLPRSIATSNKQMEFNRSSAIDFSSFPDLPSFFQFAELKEGVFPWNVTFHSEDFLRPTRSIGVKFDVIFCMSVTKWIHLNHGDHGLLQFFRSIYRSLTENGIFICEYQHWKSYLNCKSSTPEIKARFPTLRLRPEDFEKILIEDIGFELLARLGTPLEEAKAFNRPILVLRKVMEEVQSTEERKRKGVESNNEKSINNPLQNQNHNSHHHSQDSMDLMVKRSKRIYDTGDNHRSIDDSIDNQRDLVDSYDHTENNDDVSNEEMAEIDPSMDPNNLYLSHPGTMFHFQRRPKVDFASNVAHQEDSEDV